MKKRFPAIVLSGLLCLMAACAALLPGVSVTAVATEEETTTITPYFSTYGSSGPARRGMPDDPYVIHFPKHTNMEIPYLRHIYNNVLAYSGQTGYMPREGTQYFQDSNTGALFRADWTSYGGVEITQQ